MDNQQERDLFEAAIREVNDDPKLLERWPSGSYKHHGVEGRWGGWQLARRATHAAQCKPLLWMLRTGHGDRYTDKQPEGEFADKWIPLCDCRATHAVHQQAEELPPLPAPGIWVREDFGLGDSTVHEGYSADQMHEYGEACRRVAVKPVCDGTEREAFDKALAASFPDMPAREDGSATNAKFIAFAMFQSGIALGRATHVSQQGEEADWKCFALGVLVDSRDNLGSDVDGGMVQDLATECGLLVKVEAQEPCGESCACAEYDSFLTDCYRYSKAALKATREGAARAAHPGREEGGKA